MIANSVHVDLVRRDKARGGAHQPAVHRPAAPSAGMQLRREGASTGMAEPGEGGPSRFEGPAYDEQLGQIPDLLAADPSSYQVIFNHVAAGGKPEDLVDPTGMAALQVSQAKDDLCAALTVIEDAMLEDAGTSREEVAAKATEGLPDHWPVSVQREAEPRRQTRDAYCGAEVRRLIAVQRPGCGLSVRGWWCEGSQSEV